MNAGWPRNTLVNDETGRRQLTIESLIQIAGVLNIPAAVLLLDDLTLATLITQFAREPTMITDVRFFLDARGNEPPEA